MERPPQVTVRRVSWSDAGAALREIRLAVFVREQHVPEDLEWDGMDEKCLHVLAETSAGEAVGTARLLPDAHIGRMAVLPAWRQRGVGGMLLIELMTAARERGQYAIELSAQTHAIGFYRRFGFEVFGGEYMDAGIPHRIMRCSAVRPPPG